MQNLIDAESRSNAVDAERQDWEAEIRQLEERVARAFMARDIDELGRIFADDFIVNSPINRINRKGETLGLLAKGIIGHYSQELHIEVVERHGEVIVVMGNDVVTNAPDGPPIRRRFTDIWVPVGPSWRLSARHANHVAEP